MSRGSGSSMIVWLKVNHWCGKKIRVVLKVPVEDLDWSIKCTEKLFVWIGHGKFVGGGSKLEFLPEFRQLKEHRFGFVGHRSSDV